MQKDLEIISGCGLSNHLLNESLGDALKYRNSTKAKSSLETYRWGWKRFLEWCGEGFDPATFLPGEIPASLFISNIASKKELKLATIDCYLAAINHHYHELGLPFDITHPELKKIRKGIRRELGTSQTQKAPLCTETIKLLIDSFYEKNDPASLRDRSLILLGFAGAFRRSELIGIDVEHLDFSLRGISIFMAKSKTDQEGKGRVVDIPFTSGERYCPVRNLKKWLEHRKNGPVFTRVYKGGRVSHERLTGKSVAMILKSYCHPFGYSDTISGNSLRSGHVTTAIRNGTPESWIMRQTGHKNFDTLRKYERMHREFEANSAAKIGL